MQTQTQASNGTSNQAKPVVRPAPSKLAGKLARIMGTCGHVQFDAKNDFANYKYASAAAVYANVRKALSEAGIAVAFNDELVQFQTVEKTTYSVVRSTMILVDSETGESYTTIGYGQGHDKGDKAVMKATTAARKYAVSGMVLLSWGEDPEADPVTDGAESKSQARRVAAQKKTTTPRKTKAIKAEEASELANQLRASIEAAKTAQELTGVGQEVVNHKDSLGELYQPLVQCYKNREQSL